MMHELSICQALLIRVAEIAAEVGAPIGAELLVNSVETLAGDAKTVAAMADELANEKVERIKTKHVRDDKAKK